jgi:tetratricopeptide (TPR) repeat protein
VPLPPSPLAQGPFIEDPTDEDYADAARAALSAKDHRLALEQAAAAASLRPLHEPHVKLLDDAIAATKGPLQALELKPEGTFFGLVAARARALARFHRMGEALDCLFQATTFSPKTPFLAWAGPWVAHASDARRVTPAALALAIVKLLDASPSLVNLEAALAIAAKVQAAAGDGDGVLIVARSRILRALGRDDEALALLAGRVDWTSVVERGAIHRDRNETAERVRCFEEASVLRPDDVATLLDLGDAYVDDARLDDATRAYEKALTLRPSQAWATASLAYVRFLDTGEPVVLPAEASEPVRAMVVDTEVYVSRLSDPIDPIVGVLRSVAQTSAPPPDRPLRIRVRAERPLAPTAKHAFDLLLARLCRQGTLEVAHEGRGAPRPGPLWKDTPDGYVPAVSCPSDTTIDAVTAIASTPFAWSGWMNAAAASPLASTEELLAAMVHVPPAPKGHDVVQYVHGFQIAAALCIASRSEGPETRLDALSPLLEGGDDWTSAAALLGLLALAELVPELGARIEARAAKMVPSPQEALTPMARALAVTGSKLTSGEARANYLRLRARVRREIAAG